MFLCVAVAAACSWLAILNVGVAASDVPFAFHGRRVTVTIDRCSLDGHGVRTCRGSYLVDGRSVTDQPVLGADAATPGSIRSATVDSRHPGPARAEDPRAAFGEALIFALAGAVLAVLAGRGALRAQRRRGDSSTPSSSSSSSFSGPVAPSPPPAPDPLDWVRRRRFGAGG